MKCLWSISLFVLLIAGCVSIKPSHLARDTSQVARLMSRATKYLQPATSHLFKASLDIRKHHLTGLLLIKRMETFPLPSPQLASTPPPPQQGRGDCSGTYRIVFMNEVGLTFFDLEMQPDSFKVVSCFASLNKKALMKIFETDFRMLLWSGSLQQRKIFRQAGTNNMVQSGTSGRYKTWQTYSPAGDTLFAIKAKSNITDPVFISFDQYKDDFPMKIIIENPIIGMKLSLRKLAK
jgi:hypothetical protein